MRREQEKGEGGKRRREKEEGGTGKDGERCLYHMWETNMMNLHRKEVWTQSEPAERFRSISGIETQISHNAKACNA